MGKSTTWKILTGLFFCSTVALLASTIYLATKSDDDETEPEPEMSNVPLNIPFDIETIISQGENSCAGTNPAFENVDCIHVEGPQAGANVTTGYVGGMNVSHTPQMDPYILSQMCAVNVHWHLGTEHYSMGEYDEDGDGPNGNIPAPASDRRLADDKEDIRAGFRCHHYDKDDPKFTKPYEWKHCIDMELGETYEVHWPHSVFGACGKVDQYQTPFYDGVFCNSGVETLEQFQGLPQQVVAHGVGVQAQIFTIVNDEAYFYPDLIRGWIIDGDFAKDIAYYTGSTTGTTRSNSVCSMYAPITWQVDRKCHMISASSFDKLCYDMKNQRDDMSYDLHAHGSRELVKTSLVANNQARRKVRIVFDDEDEDKAWF